MMDSGQNDIHYGLEYMIEEEVKKSIPNIISQFTVVVVQLYEKGARAFWIHNTGPIGCLPYFLVEYPPSPDNADQNGCVKSYNEVAQEFNKQLKDSVSRLRDQHPDAVLICVDLYSAKYSLISNAKDYVQLTSEVKLDIS
ncbi:GDSL esterase/lipase [Capsicum annuum]|nr:GDSL esterase/lipase [Capsicum annuum]